MTAGLRLMKKQCGKAERKLFDKLILGIERGSPLSQLFLAEGFPLLVYSLVVVGEANGDLAKSFYRLSDHYEAKLSFRRDVWNASFYPLLVCIASIVTAFFLLYVILPQFEVLYLQMGFPLPEDTQRLFRWAGSIRAILPWFVFSSFTVLLLLFFSRRKLPRMMKQTIAKILFLPFIKDIYRVVFSYRLVENLSLLLSSGLPILDVLQRMADVSLLPYERQTVEHIRAKILAGSTLSEALSAQPWVDIRVLLAIEIAEATGDLSAACEYVAGELSQELRNKSKRFIQLLEPSMLLFLGGVIGVITLAMILPMVELVQSIR
ncbi:hypothetical protein DNHGIG_01380 [Collibacillus ludicampi]|uniref:Type II secretion system protein GspF domain-containing protein n=1 Tax=Collibacillus ludicampi TaxID=2771369 RepID=A0AAV4LA30_9BACL|nr:hypothetical protein DNHGIG_01380 [Collibacillus ludicampi]